MTKYVDYQVRLTQFHNGKVKELVVPNPDDSYTIFIESTLSREEQQKAFLHAMAHISNHDFEKKSPADILEIRAHFA